MEAGFNSQAHHHYHLGTGAIRRSTLADANAKRSTEVFAETARLLMSQAKRKLRREGEELLYLLDSTSITLKGPGFDAWTQANRTRRTQGIKLHVLYAARAEQEGYPVRQSLTPPNVNDRDEGVKMPLETGATYVFYKCFGFHLVAPHRARGGMLCHPLQAQRLPAPRTGPTHPRRGHRDDPRR